MIRRIQNNKVTGNIVLFFCLCVCVFLFIQSFVPVHGSRQPGVLPVSYLQISLAIIIFVVCIVLARFVKRKYPDTHQLSEKDAYYHAVISNVNDAVFSVDANARIVSWEMGAEMMYGWKESEVLGKNADELLQTGYESIPKDQLNRDIKDPGYYKVETSQKNKLGKDLFVYVNASALFGEDGSVQGVVFVNKDITALKKMQEAIINSPVAEFRVDTAQADYGRILNTITDALLLSKQRINIVARTTNDSIWDWDLEKNTVVREYTQLETLFGFAPFADAEVDYYWQKYTHPDDWEKMRIEREKIFADPSLSYWEGEYRFLHKNGNYGYVYDKGYVIRNDEGKAVRMIGVSQDISRRKMAEQQLLAQKYFFQQMFEQSSVSTQILDKDGWCERINPKLSEIFGVSPDNIEGHKYNIFKDEELRRNQVLPILEKVFKDGETAEWEINFDIGVAADAQNITVAEKKKVWYQNWAYPIFDAQGNLQNVIIQHTDVSDRKRAEESLRTSELRFRSLIEKGSEVIALHDREGKVLYMSPSIRTLLGYDPEERIGRSGLENVHPEDLSRIVETLQKLISQPGSVVSAQWRHLHADGSWHWMDGVATNLLDDPNVNAVVHNFRDITKQKLAEEKIILEKELSAFIINSLPGIFYLYDESLHLLRWNNNFSTVSGYTSSELQQMSPLDFFEGHEKRLVRANIEKVFAQGKAEMEANLYTKDKQKIPFHFTGWATEFEGKRCMIGMGIDISLRKLNEAQLKLLESVVTHASDGIIITEAENINGDGPKIMYVNQAFCKMTGYRPDELIGKTPRMLQGPDTDRKELDKLRKALENWTPFTTEIINYQKSGKPFWVQISLTPVANQEGWYTHWIAVENDISMRKEAEQELKVKNSELQKLSNYLKNVREDERKFLAREVHDELGQLASAIKIDIDWLSPKFPKNDTNIEKRVSHANHTIEVLISTIRKIAASLRPSVLDDFGLKVALEMHCQEFAKLNDIETYFSSNINSANLTTEQKTELFRMTQESLTNVMRHAMAKKVNVSLLENDSMVQLSIEDDGIGFDSNIKKNTLGLIGLRERAASLQGKLTIQSEPGKGTVVKVEIPKSLSL